MKTFKDTWDNFANLVIDKNASEMQFREMKLAFYAGASQLINLMMDETINLSDEDAAEQIHSWHIEIKQHFKETIDKHTIQ